MRPKLKHRKPWLTFAQKRYIAKEIISGKEVKNIVADWNVSHSFVSTIRRDFVVETLSERYPDGYDTQGELPLATQKPQESD